MNFDLKTLDLNAAATHKTDALIILVSANDKPAKGVLSQLISDTRKSGDLDASPAKLLSVWRPHGVTAARVVLVSSGDGSARVAAVGGSATAGALVGAADVPGDGRAARDDPGRDGRVLHDQSRG
jgi:hypothetical protein